MAKLENIDLQIYLYNYLDKLITSITNPISELIDEIINEIIFKNIFEKNLPANYEENSSIVFQDNKLSKILNSKEFCNTVIDISNTNTDLKGIELDLKMNLKANDIHHLLHSDSIIIFNEKNGLNNFINGQQNLITVLNKNCNSEMLNVTDSIISDTIYADIPLLGNDGIICQNNNLNKVVLSNNENLSGSLSSKLDGFICETVDNLINQINCNPTSNSSTDNKFNNINYLLDYNNNSIPEEQLDIDPIFQVKCNQLDNSQNLNSYNPKKKIFHSKFLDSKSNIQIIDYPKLNTQLIFEQNQSLEIQKSFNNENFEENKDIFKFQANTFSNKFLKNNESLPQLQENKNTVHSLKNIKTVVQLDETITYEIIDNMTINQHPNNTEKQVNQFDIIHNDNLSNNLLRNQTIEQMNKISNNINLENCIKDNEVFEYNNYITYKNNSFVRDVFNEEGRSIENVKDVNIIDNKNCGIYNIDAVSMTNEYSISKANDINYKNKDHINEIERIMKLKNESCFVNELNKNSNNIEYDKNIINSQKRLLQYDDNDEHNTNSTDHVERIGELYSEISVNDSIQMVNDKLFTSRDHCYKSNEHMINEYSPNSYIIINHDEDKIFSPNRNYDEIQSKSNITDEVNLNRDSFSGLSDKITANKIHSKFICEKDISMSSCVIENDCIINMNENVNINDIKIIEEVKRVGHNINTSNLIIYNNDDEIGVNNCYNQNNVMCDKVKMEDYVVEDNNIMNYIKVGLESNININPVIQLITDKNEEYSDKKMLHEKIITPNDKLSILENIQISPLAKINSCDLYLTEDYNKQSLNDSNTNHCLGVNLQSSSVDKTLFNLMINEKEECIKQNLVASNINKVFSDNDEMNAQEISPKIGNLNDSNIYFSECKSENSVAKVPDYLCGPQFGIESSNDQQIIIELISNKNELYSRPEERKSKSKKFFVKNNEPMLNILAEEKSVNNDALVPTTSEIKKINNYSFYSIEEKDERKNVSANEPFPHVFHQNSFLSFESMLVPRIMTCTRPLRLGLSRKRKSDSNINLHMK